MDVLVVGRADVRRLLTMESCIAAMEDAFGALAASEAVLPLRQIMWLPDGASAVLAMLSYLGDVDAAAVKVISVFPRNEGTPFESHQGVVVVFEGERGRPVAIVDAGEVTTIRTAAVSGLATRLLAREDAGDLAILGAGAQAGSHLEAMVTVRRVRRVRVWSRTHERARAFAQRESARHGVEVEVAADARAAVEGADLVCTTTSAREPILLGEWLASGAHVNAVGFSGPSGRELDGAAMARARLFADRRESALNESGDVLLAIQEGAITEDHLVAELADVVVGRVPGRTSDDEITLFESLGLAIEDLAAARLVYERASREGAGASVPLGGLREDDEPAEAAGRSETR